MWCQNTTFIGKMLVKMLDKIRRNDIMAYANVTFSFLVSTQSACATESESEHFLM